MAVWIRWTEQQDQMWKDWIASRPPVIQEMVEKHNLRADKLYRLKSTGQRVILRSLEENGTVTIDVLEQFNEERMLAMGGLLDRTVFGINPADLEECEWDGDVVEGNTIDIENTEG